MNWSPAMRKSRRERHGQVDAFDEAVLSMKLVCNGSDPLTNRFVVTRRAHDCDICQGQIEAGRRVRRETRRSADGLRIETRYVCEPCADAIELWAQGDDEPICVRYDIGKARRQDACPGHVAHPFNPKICGRCGIHIDELRPPDGEDLEP